ncbi:unnamed protein product [Caenorhabditis auriculariae]|uniref:Uncharacterized protein n=1 Tax=Caenorhabditis auriculariae TaxID=2777116 RepID=A0A8S1HKB6_9PELO|nr:unnamed protein product [Caenorhabditis auriculariae]
MDHIFSEDEWRDFLEEKSKLRELLDEINSKKVEMEIQQQELDKRTEGVETQMQKLKETIETVKNLSSEAVRAENSSKMILEEVKRERAEVLKLTEMLGKLQLNQKPNEKGDLLAEENLRSAASDGDFDQVRELIREGVNVNSRDPCSDKTALMCSVQNGHLIIVHWLLENGADVSAATELGTTALHYASQCHGAEAGEIVSALVDHGADLNVSDRNGNTPLHNAVSAEFAIAFQSLIDCGADINSCPPRNRDQETPLHLAVLYNNLSAIKLLLERGADIHLKDYHGNTALSIAQRFGNEEVQKIFVKSQLARKKDLRQ